MTSEHEQEEIDRFYLSTYISYLNERMKEAKK